VAELTLNRPDKRNAISLAMVAELERCIATLPAAVGVVVLALVHRGSIGAAMRVFIWGGTLIPIWGLYRGYGLLDGNLLFLPVAALNASGAGKGHAAQSPSPTPSSEVINQPLSVFELKGSHREIFRRVLQARLYHLGTWTLSDPSQTPVTAARTIASLKPTFAPGASVRTFVFIFQL
jgi:hypothetical protein